MVFTVVEDGVGLGVGGGVNVAERVDWRVAVRVGASVKLVEREQVTPTEKEVLRDDALVGVI